MLRIGTVQSRQYEYCEIVQLVHSSSRMIRSMLEAAGPPVAQNLARCIHARNTRYAAARMRARSAHVQMRERSAVVRIAENRPRAVELVERQRTVKDIAA